MIRTGIRMRHLYLQPGQSPRTVAKEIDRSTHSIDSRQKEVANRTILAKAGMAIRIDRSSAAASKQDRQVLVIMAVPIADPTAIDDHALIEQRSVPFLNRFQFFQQIG